MENDLNCLKHPYIKTGERCVRCKAPLCKDCRIKNEPSPYCSSYCLNADRLQHIFARLKCAGPKKDIFSESEKLANYADTFATLLVVLFTATAILLPSPGRNITKETATRKDEAGIQAMKTPPLKTRPKPETVPKKGLEGGRKERAKTGKNNNGKRTVKIKTGRDLSKTALSISRVKGAGKSLSITFDGGSSDSSARAILDILSEKRIKSTFFLTGRFIKKYPDIVKRMVMEGHEVGNHTMTHPHLTTYSVDRKRTTSSGVSFSFLKREMDDTAGIFKEVTGQNMAPLWRAPYGETNREILKWASKIGYRHIAWTVDYEAHQTMDSLDWVTDKTSSLYLTAEEIKEKLLSFADEKGRAEGGIILMHLGTERKKEIVHEKLGELIETFMARGYRILPVSKLIKKNAAGKV